MWLCERRAGREGPGKAYRLYTEASFQQLAPTTLPEIQRTNLAAVVLQVRAGPGAGGRGLGWGWGCWCGAALQHVPCPCPAPALPCTCLVCLHLLVVSKVQACQGILHTTDSCDYNEAGRGLPCWA